MKILIVDDEDISRTLLKNILKESDYDILEAEDGYKAWELFNENEIRIVITDLVMPRMDGLELCRKIRRLNLENYAYIIIIKAKDSKKDAAKGMDAGADDYINKPFDPWEVRTRVRAGQRIIKLEDDYKSVNLNLEVEKNRLKELFLHSNQIAEEANNSYIELRQVFNLSAEGMWVIDKDFNVLRINEKLLRHAGKSAEKAIGDKCYNVFSTPFCHGPDCPMNRIREGAEHFERDIEIEREDGSKTPFFLTSTPLGGIDGELSGIVVNLKDISIHKRAEALLEAKMDAESSNKSKGQFLANMSHEMRTPLNGIIGMTELAMDTELDDSQREIFETIISEATSLLRLINDILDFSKIEAGRLELEEAPFNLRVMFEDVVKSASLSARKKGLALSSFLAPDVPNRLLGDPGRLRQILNNLVANAMKFTHKGKVSIKGDLSEKIGDHIKLRFSVNDTGIGIPKNRQAEIFERFTQADCSTTREYGGSGLGTTISKQLVEMMGGEIGLESDEGKGSTFWFTAVFGEPSGQELPMETKDVDLKGRKIMLVGGSRKERSELREHLNRWGCRTLDVSDGKDALSNLRKHALSKEPFDLVLTDFQIPGMDGFELVKEIRATEELNGVPIVLLTSIGKIGDGNICRDMGIDGYLCKPADKDDLKGVIELLLTLSNGDKKLSERRLITRHTVAEEYKKEIRILLAEDYITNQKVAMKHLRGAGYEVDLAENGQQAVDLFMRKHYDLILMDIQMPKIGGFEATSEIRRLESQKLSKRGGIKRIPIIAMTAHAMKGYRKRCIEAGMDDYISKPLRRGNLLALVEKWIMATAQGEGITGQETKEATDIQPSIVSRKSKDCAPLNFERAVKEFDGDKGFLIEVLGDFFGEVRSQTETIRQAISDDDAEVIRREAHGIKGGAANLTAEPLSMIAYELEKIGKSGSSAGGIEILERLEKEFHRLEEYTQGIQKNGIHL